MRREKLYRRLAGLILQRQNCAKSGNTEWLDKSTARIHELVKEHMPSGSGFDSGTLIDLYKSTGDKLVFDTSFHHMDESGGYDGWTQHAVTVRPSLWTDFTLTVSGRNRNDIKNLIAEEFGMVLREEVEP